MAVLDILLRSWGDRCRFYCPACKSHHVIHRRLSDGKIGPVWTFNGNLEKPTFSPSIKVTGTRPFMDERPTVCHSFVRDGRIEFLSDCTHELAGQTVDLPQLDLSELEN